MKPETRDRLIASMNRIVVNGTGGNDLYSSVVELKAFLEKLQEILAHFESPERMREDLDRMEEPTPVVLAMLEGTIRHAPTLIHRWIKERIKMGLKALPNPTTGRPIAIPLEQRTAICDEVSSLERNGLSLWSAKRKVAKKYGVNARTIHRIWEMRSNYEAGSEVVSLDQAQDFIRSIIQETGSTISHHG